MIQRAKDLIKYPKKYDKVTSAGSASYVKNIAFDKNTGEIVEGKALELNMETLYHLLYFVSTDLSSSGKTGKQISCNKYHNRIKKVLLCTS